MPILIKLACPNCGYNLAEENLHSNILQCPRCNSYTYYESGMYNVNVFFGVLRCQTYQLDKLRSIIIDKYVNQASLKAIKNFKFLHAERLLIPMREIDINGHPKTVPLLSENRETIGENTDIRQLLQNQNDINSLFSMQYLLPLRLGDFRDDIDNSGYITHTTILPVGRTKRAVDTAYNLKPDSLLRILYVPIYRLSFNDKGLKMLCFANGELTGLTIGEAPEKMGFDFGESLPIAVVGSIFLTIIVDIVLIARGNFHVEASDYLMEAIGFIIVLVVSSLIIALIICTAIIVVLLFFSKVSVSLNVITSVKKWLIRRILIRKFRLNEKRR